MAFRSRETTPAPSALPPFLRFPKGEFLATAASGHFFKELRDTNRFFPPPVPTGGKPWQLKFRGYQHDDILERPVKTSTEGEAEFAFTPEREGYYRVVWTSDTGKGTLPRARGSIHAETAVWVARNNTTELGYRHGGLEIIVDKETFQAGKTAPILLNVPSADRYVLLATEAEELYSYQLVHVTGTVKLVELQIEEKHVPNLFLSAAMVSDRQFFMDTKQVVVPPVKNFLRVEVKPDRGQYEPREEGTWLITSRDQEDKPVSAELALGLVDESGLLHPTGVCGRSAPVLLRRQTSARDADAKHLEFEELLQTRSEWSRRAGGRPRPGER
ncbi:MAG: hypothetical protein L0387_35195 [Acidobacteria bacterium]|nr:hypothetical protein [Acidobacteriota bacterium]MCI0724995.1 hypothetical protein [Acidobacteriota bacterium]